MPRVSPDTLEEFVTRAIESTGTRPEAARMVARHLVESNLSGHDSHGVMRLKQYLDHVASGDVQPAAEPTIVHETSTTAVVDGGQTWGQVAASFAMDVAIRKARDHAIAAVSLRRAYHAGRIGVYPRQAALEGLVGLAFCNVRGVARVAPWGSTERRLTTNPIAIAVPTESEPIVIDFATSAVAEGKVRLAKTDGRKVPIGWCLDAEGNFTTDPNSVYEDGALAPLGGDQGHKGYSLSVAMDLLGGILSGAGCGLMTRGYGNGLLLQAIDPAAFCGPADFRGQIAEYTEYLKSARRKKDCDEILMPGEPETRQTAERRRHGLQIEAGVWSQLEDVGRQFGISLEKEA